MTDDYWENEKARPSQLSWQALLDLSKEDEGTDEAAQGLAFAKTPLQDFTAKTQRTPRKREKRNLAVLAVQIGDSLNKEES
ncbi:MAG: hypothetical protein GX927_11780 [Lentisphaerae bacterium]|jgi:hypothetical protein|nr:hypothetical protein [Lentisphaerota bacterium]